MLDTEGPPQNAAVRDRAVERFRARLRMTHAIEVDGIVDAVSYLVEPDDTVIFGGSLAFGFGNRSSDLDIIVVSGGKDDDAIPVQRFIDGLRVEVWRIAAARLREVINRADAATRAHDPIEDAFEDVRLLTRVGYGPVWAGRTPSELFGCDVPRICSDFMVARLTQACAVRLGYADLAMRQPDVLHAAHQSRAALEMAVQAVLTRRTQTFPGRKFLYQQAQRDDEDLFRTLTSCAVIPAQRGECTDYVRDLRLRIDVLLAELGDVLANGSVVTLDVRPLETVPLGGSLLVCDVEHSAVLELSSPAEVAAMHDLSRTTADLRTSSDDVAALALRLVRAGLARLCYLSPGRLS
jgi:predicted nucleotidyltransferase